MSAEHVSPDGWPRGVGYAHGSMAVGRVVCTAGQIGWNPVTQRMVSDDFAAQVDQALANVSTVLQAAGASGADLVRVNWYITSRTAYLQARREIGQAWRRSIGAHYPAMTVVVVAELIEPDALVEIEATAVIPA